MTVVMRVAEYFKELLNPQFNRIMPEERTYFGPEWDIKPPTIQEVSRVIRNMKNNRALGEDLTAAELFKHRGSMLRRRIHCLKNYGRQNRCRKSGAQPKYAQ
jgi:hypothetical protein